MYYDRIKNDFFIDVDIVFEFIVNFINFDKSDGLVDNDVKNFVN